MARSVTIALSLFCFALVSACAKSYPARIRIIDGDTGLPLRSASITTDYSRNLELGGPVGERFTTDENGVIKALIHNRNSELRVEDSFRGVWSLTLRWENDNFIIQQDENWDYPTPRVETVLQNGLFRMEISVLRKQDCQFTAEVPETLEGFVLIRRRGSETLPSMWQGPRIADRSAERVFVVPPFATVVLVNPAGVRHDPRRKSMEFVGRLGSGDELWCYASVTNHERYKMLAQASGTASGSGSTRAITAARLDWIRSDLISGGDGVMESRMPLHPNGR